MLPGGPANLPAAYALPRGFSRRRHGLRYTQRRERTRVQPAGVLEILGLLELLERGPGVHAQHTIHGPCLEAAIVERALHHAHRIAVVMLLQGCRISLLDTERDQRLAVQLTGRLEVLGFLEAADGRLRSPAHKAVGAARAES